MLKTGDDMPHFRAVTLEGRTFNYGDIWQRKNLVLIVVPDTPSPELAGRVAEWSDAGEHSIGDDSQWVITTDHVPGFRPPAVVVADKWSEIQFTRSGCSVADLPGGDELVEWLEYVRNQCPECQGEAK